MKNVGNRRRNAERTSVVATAGSMSKAIADIGIIPKRMLTTSIAGNGGKEMTVRDIRKDIDDYSNLLIKLNTTTQFYSDEYTLTLSREEASLLTTAVIEWREQLLDLEVRA